MLGSVMRSEARHYLIMTPYIGIPSRSALLIAAAAGCDARTAERALRHGAHVVRYHAIREAIIVAARDLGIALPLPEDA